MVVEVESNVAKPPKSTLRKSLKEFVLGTKSEPDQPRIDNQTPTSPSPKEDKLLNIH